MNTDDEVIQRSRVWNWANVYFRKIEAPTGVESDLLEGSPTKHNRDKLKQ